MQPQAARGFRDIAVVFGEYALDMFPLQPFERHTLAGRVASWWVPDAVVRLDAMPLAPTGKIDKKALRQIYALRYS